MARHERRFQSFGSRWGKGVVHRYLYSRENQVWYVACRRPYNDPYGRETDPSTPITCKKCQ